MAIRFVELSNEIQTEDAAEQFVHLDSGRAVFPTGRTKRVYGGFAVECYSVDGRPSSMFSTGATIRTTGELPSTRDMPDILPDQANLDAVIGLESEGEEVMDAHRKRERFRVVSVDGDRATIAYRSDNFKITVPASDLKSAQPGEDVEGVILGMGERLLDVFIFGREHLVELFPGFARVGVRCESEPPEGKGWSPYSNPQKPAGKE